MNPYFHLSDMNLTRLNAEKARVLDSLGALVSPEYTHEVGSTAVLGVIGKQDLDFLVRVPFNDFIETRNTLDKVFSRNPEQLSNEQYQGYHVESPMDVAIQLTTIDGPYDNFLEFLNALRDCDDLKQEYNALKLKFNGAPMTEYRCAKQMFIERVLQQQ